MVYDNLGNKISPKISKTNINSAPQDDNIHTLLELEQAEIKKALKLYNGNITKSSKALGISRNALYEKMKRYNIKKRTFNMLLTRDISRQNTHTL